MFNYIWRLLRRIIFRNNIPLICENNEKKEPKITEATVQTSPTISNTSNVDFILKTAEDHYEDIKRKLEVIMATERESIQKQNEVIADIISKLSNYVQTLNDTNFEEDVNIFKIQTNQKRPEVIRYRDSFNDHLPHFKDQNSLLLISTVFKFNFPTFDGTTSFTKYKEQFEQCIEVAYTKHCGWSDEHTLFALLMSLRRPAAGKKILDAILNALAMYKEDNSNEHYSQLKVRKQNPDEGLQEWAIEVDKLYRLHSPYDLMYYNNITTYFIEGISDERVRDAVKLGNYKKLEDALSHALEVELEYKESERATIQEETKPIIRTTCYRCGQLGRYIKRIN